MNECVKVADPGHQRRIRSAVAPREPHRDGRAPSLMRRNIAGLSRTMVFATALAAAGLNLHWESEARAKIRDPVPVAGKEPVSGMAVRIPLAWLDIEKNYYKTANIGITGVEAEVRDAAHRMAAAGEAADRQALEREAANRKAVNPATRIRTTSASKSLKRIKPAVLKLLVQVQAHFNKPLHIVSGCRSKSHNRRVGGAGRSQHLHCNAVDFQIPGVSKGKLSIFLKRMRARGGVGTYCRSSYVHLDAGPRRVWHWPCRKRKKTRDVVSKKSKPTPKKSVSQNPTSKKSASNKSASSKPVAPPRLKIEDLIN